MMEGVSPLSTRAISAASRPSTCNVDQRGDTEPVAGTPGHDSAQTFKPGASRLCAPCCVHQLATLSCRTCPLSAQIDSTVKNAATGLGGHQNTVDRAGSSRTLAGFPPRGAWSGTCCAGVADAKPREPTLQQAAAAWRRELSIAGGALESAVCGLTLAMRAALPPNIVPP